MADRLPPLPALRALEALARSGSLTKAAESLFVTHGAVSHQLKALEEQIGVALVEREGRGVRLTDEGARLAQRIRSALSEIADAVREARERRNPRQLVVTAVPSFAARWLLPRIGRFMRAHPDIDLDVRANGALADFRRDDVDVGIRHGSGQWPGVLAEHLLDEDCFPVCSPRLAGGHLPSVPADLARYTLLRGDGEYWQPWFKAAGLDWPEPTRGPIFNDSSHMMQAAAEGQGVALARQTLLANDVRNGVLVRLFDIAVRSPYRTFLVYPPRLAASPKLAAFRDWLRREIEADVRRGDAIWPLPASRRSSSRGSRRSPAARPAEPARHKP
jgi:LysR family glycine cleavage system transcriptional activator